MACDSCGNTSDTNLPLNIYGSPNPIECETTNCGGILIDSLCVRYTSTNFNCISNDSKSLENILKSIDSLICENSGGIPWNTFDYACLENITTAQSFVETISSYVCDLNTTVTNNYEELSELIENIINETGTYVPAISGCTYTGVINTDNLYQILVKYNTKFCDLNSRLDISSVDFDQCFTVLTPPTTIAGAFDELIDQICQVKASIPIAVTLPTFNNIGSCLPSPGATDTLVNTINKIKTVLCSKPDFNAASLSPFPCVAAGTNLQSTIENIRAKISVLVNNQIDEVGPGLTLTPLAAPEACEGQRLTIDIEAIPDEKVAANSSDGTPGFLIDKLAEGPGIIIDDTTNPGQVTISASNLDVKVKTSVLDPLSDYLVAKLSGGTDTGISINITEDTITNPSSYTANIAPIIDWDSFTEKILLTIVDSEYLRSIFCNIDCNDTASCVSPSNFMVDWDEPTSTYTVGWGVPVGATSVVLQYREKFTSTWLDSPGITPPNPQSPSSATSVSVTGLDPVTTYQFRLLVTCEVGETTSPVRESMSYKLFTPTVTPSSQTIDIDFGTNTFIDSMHVILKNANTNVVVSTQQSIGPDFEFTFPGLTPGSYNPEYYYKYTINGIQYSSADASQHGSNYLLSTVQVS